MELFAKIKSTVKREGLVWGENCALKPVAYGIKKICMTAVIPMNVSMDEIIEEILEDVFPVIRPSTSQPVPTFFSINFEQTNVGTNANLIGYHRMRSSRWR